MLEKILARALRGFRRAPSKGYWNLSPKRGNKNYYKGKGSISTGRHTRKGGYLLLERKLPRYIVPDLSGFQLKPYISITTPKIDNKEALKLIEEKRIRGALKTVKESNIKKLGDIEKLIGEKSEEEINALQEARVIILRAGLDLVRKVAVSIKLEENSREKIVSEIKENSSKLPTSEAKIKEEEGVSPELKERLLSKLKKEESSSETKSKN